MLKINKKKAFTLLPLILLITSLPVVNINMSSGSQAAAAPSWFKKASYPDYAPSGMPDFDQKQDGWFLPAVGWTWCGPVAVANSLWWFDSKYESIYNPSPAPPPTMSDSFGLVTSYNPPGWDDHDPQNLQPLVLNLAWLMDTDGQRTSLTHSGTNYIDMETGISQYLQQQGINPTGDADGDGDVDNADIAIINASIGSSPGSPGWNMAADVVIDNIIDANDLAAATANNGSVGMFYEHTTDFPDFSYIEGEVERSQDVVLLLEFWNETAPGIWERNDLPYDLPGGAGGHYVTVAGVNSTTLELLISDPWWDAAEAGFPGDIPVQHPYPHTTDIHNDTMFVSHDAYLAAFWPPSPPPPQSPYPAQPIWELLGYLQQMGWPPTWHTFIRSAVVTSPLAQHDVAVINVHSIYSWVYQGENDPINVTVENQGNFNETVDVYAFYAPGAPAAPNQTISLAPGVSQTLTFNWNTTGIPPGFYTVSANATISVDNDPSDNTLTGNTEEVRQQPPWFIKASYPDYVLSGMPDFDQKQDNWGPGQGIYTWCGPVAVANSLWWLDSEYESIYNPSPMPPPTISDSFPMVESYNPGVWDDHDPRNLGPLVGELAFLMDTDGQRTGLAHTGTNYLDMEAGLSQYLQWHNVNPIGDCDGDGDVDDDDITIINNAMGTTPGVGAWDMRADMIIDNIIDMADLNAAMANYGQVGMFYEHTENFPQFPWIESEIYACEDVVLFLEFWQNTGPGEWIPLYDNPSLEAGHFVTCAGVNSSTVELLISDPYWDAAEAGYWGDIPVPHPSPHLPDVHNDTQYVSHDAYPAALWSEPPPSPYPGMPVWELIGYLQQLGYDPSWHAFIRVAVVTSPLAQHDVAVINVTTSKTGCLPLETVGQGNNVSIYVTVENQGGFTETFNVTSYGDSNIIGTLPVTLNPGENQTLTYTWNTTGVAYGNYTISATADFVSGEIDVADNTMVDGTLLITIPGDIDGDRKVDIFDIVRIASIYGVSMPNPRYNPNCDMDDDGDIDIFDVVKAATNYGKSW